MWLYLGLQSIMIGAAFLQESDKCKNYKNVLLDRAADHVTFRSMASDFWTLKFLAEKEKQKKKKKMINIL